MKPITFHKDRVFRETKGVHFSDVWVTNQNGLDLDRISDIGGSSNKIKINKSTTYPEVHIAMIREQLI